MRTSILACVALAACGGDDDGGGGGGGEPTVVLMDSVGPEGGMFQGDGVRLEFPPDALSETLDFMVTAAEVPVAGYTRYTPVFTFEPRDVSLNIIAVSLETDENQNFYWTAQGTDTFERLDGGFYDGWSVVNVQHFGRGFVGKPGETGTMCGDGPACTGGDICMEGECVPYQTP